MDTTEDDLQDVLDYSRFVTYRIAKLSASLNKQASLVLKNHGGLNVLQWRILALVYMSGPVCSATLVKTISMDAGLFSRTLKKMIELRLISARVDKNDNRKQLLSLTKAGHKHYLQASPAMEKRRQQLTLGMTKADKETLFRLLDILEHNAEERTE